MTPHDSHPMPEPAPPPGAAAMNVVRRVLLIGLALLAVASIATWILSRSDAGRGRVAGVSTYYCPMHPSYTSDRPGECPICGMALEPMPQSMTDSSSHTAEVPGLTSVTLTPERIQLIGVRTAVVERVSLGADMDLVGFVAPNESAMRRVQLRASGWVERLHVNRTGEMVQAGQPMLTIYSPELFQSEREFLIEVVASVDTAGHTGDAAGREAGGLRAARQRLSLLGVPEAEIQRLEREREATSRIDIPAPVSGTVLERNVTEGQSVGSETVLFTIADLSQVWVIADLYEMDLARVRVGDAAQFSTDALPGQRFRARVEFVSPTVSSETRTTQARLSLDNRSGDLRPGMFGRVIITGRGAPSLVVPADAVVQTGESDYVFLVRAGGRFEPRLVRTGIRSDERIQILGGIAAGDTVVSGASFLIDSESRLKAAIAGLGAQPSTAHEGHGGAQ